MALADFLQMFAKRREKLVETTSTVETVRSHLHLADKKAKVLVEIALPGAGGPTLVALTGGFLIRTEPSPGQIILKGEVGYTP